MIDEFYDAGLIDKKTFSLCFSKKGGNLSFGKQKNTFSQSIVGESSLLSPSEYSIQVKSLQVGYSYMKINSAAKIDTHSSFTTLPQALFQTVLEEITKFAERDYYLNSDNQVCFSQVSTVKLPPIELVLNESTLIRWKPKNYAFTSKNGICLQIRGSPENELILGRTVFLSHSLTFDLDQGKIVFRRSNCDKNVIPPQNESSSRHNYIRDLVFEHYLTLLFLLVVFSVLCCILVLKGKKKRISIGFSRLKR